MHPATPTLNTTRPAAGRLVTGRRSARVRRAPRAVGGRPATLGREVAAGWLFVTGLTLTLLDAVATLVWLRTGVAYEANPLLAGLVDTVGPEATMLLRAIVGVVLLTALWTLRRRARLAFAGLVIGALVLLVVTVAHVGVAIQSVLAGAW